MANKSQMTSTKIQINLNNPNFNIQSCFGHLIIDIWILFTHKIINFKGVPRKKSGQAMRSLR